MFESHQKNEMMVKPIIQFSQGRYDMCQAESYAFVCRHKDKKSHIFLSQKAGKNKQATSTHICGTSLCMICQITFGITNKHQYAIHTCMSTKVSDATTYFSDDSYQNYVKIFLSKAKKKISKRDFGKNRKFCHNTSNIVDILGSKIINLSKTLRLNEF